MHSILSYDSTEIGTFVINQHDYFSLLSPTDILGFSCCSMNDMCHYIAFTGTFKNPVFLMNVQI